MNFSSYIKIVDVMKVLFSFEFSSEMCYLHILRVYLFICGLLKIIEIPWSMMCWIMFVFSFAVLVRFIDSIL